jgi:protein arginine kinase activator
MPGPSCDRCGAAATHFLAQVAGDQVSAAAFCGACLPKLALEAVLPASAAGLSVHVPQPASRAACPACGFRWPDFERHQRLGCPRCYDAHATQARALVARSQPALTHQGRRPGTPAAPLQREMEGLGSVDRHEGEGALETRLAEAIRSENYEEAARLRDLIAARGTGRKA